MSTGVWNAAASRATVDQEIGVQIPALAFLVFVPMGKTFHPPCLLVEVRESGGKQPCTHTSPRRTERPNSCVSGLDGVPRENTHKHRELYDPIYHKSAGIPQIENF